MPIDIKRTEAIAIVVAALASLHPALGTAAAPVAAQVPSVPVAQEGKDDVLNEVLVIGEKPSRKVADLIPFLRRILGQYTVDGKVDLGGKGKPDDRWTAAGTGNCIGFGIAPGVQCELSVKWPQIPGPNGMAVMSGVFGMEPMMILYGLDPDDLGIAYMQVNNKGLAEGEKYDISVRDSVRRGVETIRYLFVMRRQTEGMR